MTTLDETLVHFGIKGMKWGVRRKNSSTSSPASDDSRRAASAQKIVKTSGTKALTNKELQDLVTRMNLERQFNQLKPPSKGSVAAKFVGDVLLNVGKQQATRLASDLAAKQINQMLKKA